MVGLRRGNTPLPGGLCPGLAIGIPSPIRADQRVTDGAGEATFVALVPAGAVGRDVLAQVVFPSTCEVSTISVTSF